MRFENLYKDPIIKKEASFPDASFVLISSNDKNMYGVMYTAEGSDPHPTMIILHGFPGTERNLDLAHAFRRSGWNSLVFHYRGSWGSQGCFSFQNALDDVKAALKFVRSDEVSMKYRIDRQNIVLVGHSMGGFAALVTAADDLDIKACIAMAPFDFGQMGNLAKENNETMIFLQEMFKECIIPLHGATVDGLIKEIMTNDVKWKFANNAKNLSKHNLLLIAAGRDMISVPELHYYPIINTLLSYNSDRFEYKMLDSDHSFQDKRILLTEIIESWLEKQI